jgi:uncharacterized membrane protein YjgN (DUF898 family)
MHAADAAAPGATEPYLAPETTVHIPPSTHQIAIRFTGSGSEYFRIWIVNLLLTLVTFGIYFAWAKVRRLRYFMGNTLVDGQPLGFHGNAFKMFKGYMLVGVLFGLYSLAGEFSPVAGLVAFVIVAALWPALFKSSLQFRLANTSWRGLRFRFHGDLRGAYRAMLPLFVPGTFFLALVAFLPEQGNPPTWYLVATGVGALSMLAVSPWLLWNLKQYQHNHYGLGPLQTTFRATAGSFYALSFKLVGLFLVIAVVPVFGLGSPQALFMKLGPAGMMALIIPLWLLSAACFISLKPYAQARMQNLVWTKTGNTELRFISNLPARSLIWLNLKNWFLIIITLGLYWPFAAVATARMRVEAVSIKSRMDPDLLMGSVLVQEGDAAGDAAGDFFGLDVGL